MTPRIEVIPLFATPIAISELPESARLNGELRAAIDAQRGRSAGTQHSNLGGWQSSWDMESWGGPAAARLSQAAREIAGQLTVDRAGRRVAIAWKSNMWANVNRRGDANEFHAHPASYWSAVYYVDDGGIALIRGRPAGEFGIVDDDVGRGDGQHRMDRGHAMADIAHVGRTGEAMRDLVERIEGAAEIGRAHV